MSSCASATDGQSTGAATTTCGTGWASSPWVAAQQVSTHWLRHTTLTWVERNFGYAVARAYAGHTGTTDGGATSTLQEIAVALATLGCPVAGVDEQVQAPAV